MTGIEKILIVGAGPAGMALAIALRRVGRTPQLIERASEQPSGGSGLYIVGNGTRALQQLGVADAAIRAGHIVRTQAFCDHRGTTLASVDVAAYWSGCGPCLGLRRSELLRVLSEQLEGVPIRWNATVESLQQTDSHVALRFSDGTTGTYDLVVGADGIRSSIRRLVFGAAPPRFRGQIAWRFIARRPAGIEGWTVFLGPGKAFLLVPVDEAYAYCYADLRRDDSSVPGGSTASEWLRSQLGDFAAPVRQALDALPEHEALPGLPIEDVVPQRWGQARAVLIGDAAHAMSPNMASGTALAFEDALVLAELLRQDTPAGQIVEQLGRRRGARVAWVGQQTERRDRTRSLPPVLRNLSLRLLGGRMYRDNYRPLLEPV